MVNEKIGGDHEKISGLAWDLMDNNERYEVFMAVNKEIENLKHDLKQYMDIAKDLANPWQPIETAPKDVSILLGGVWEKKGHRNERLIGIYRWHETNEDDSYEFKGWSNGGDYYGIKWISDNYEVTCWMPLPEPPKSP